MPLQETDEPPLPLVDTPSRWSFSGLGLSGDFLGQGDDLLIEPGSPEMSLPQVSFSESLS
jgi:hypothetical protein